MSLGQSVKSTFSGDKGRFVRASVAGALVALVLFTFLGSEGKLDLMPWNRSSDFYDAQARSFLDGTWEVSGGVLGIERFESHGGTYMYQGPWPAVLRLPVVALTDRFEGRMTLLSMMFGLMVAAAATTRLHWRVRRLVRGDAPLGRTDIWVAGLVTFVVCGGSALLYEASRPWVYHEAALWGAAWSLAAIDAAVGCVVDPSRRRWAWAGITTGLALMSRSSVGLAGVAAMAIIAGANLVARLRPAAADATDPGSLDRGAAALASLGSRRPAGGRARPVIAPGLAGALPLAAYAAVNWIKFRTLFSIPFWGQGFTILDPKRQAFLAENDGTLFGLKFLPTTLIHYLKPNGLSLTRAFPFVDFPAKADPVGGVTFDLVDYSGSIPATMPVLTILAILGAVAVFRRSARDRRPDAVLLRGPILGALAGALTILPFGYIANRYLADAVPVLAVAGIAGLHVVIPWVRTHGAAWARRGVPAALGVLAAFGVWVNLSHGLLFQRLYSPNVKDDLVADFLDTRYDIGQAVGLDPPIPIMEVDELPMDVPRGQIAIVGDCDAMYLSDGLDLNAVKFTPWNPVERSEAGGRYLRTIEFPAMPPDAKLPLFSMRSSEGDGILYARWHGGAGVSFEYLGPGQAYPSPVYFLPPGKTHTLDLVVDPRMTFVQVYLGDRMYYENRYLGPADAQIDVGVNTVGDPTVADSWVGTFEPLPERIGVCQELREEHHSR